MGEIVRQLTVLATLGRSTVSCRTISPILALLFSWAT